MFLAVINFGWAQNRKLSLSQLQEAMHNNPKDHRLHYLMGLMYQNQGKNRQALEAYQRAISQDPQYFEALLGIGVLKIHPR